MKANILVGIFDLLWISIFGTWKGVEGQPLAVLQEDCSGKGIIGPLLP